MHSSSTECQLNLKTKLHSKSPQSVQYFEKLVSNSDLNPVTCSLSQNDTPCHYFTLLLFLSAFNTFTYPNTPIYVIHHKSSIAKAP